MISGRVFKYGANVDTDAIIPARYLNVSEPSELAKHCMEDIDITFVDRVHVGDIILAGANFGCGSSREHAPLAIKTIGVSVVIAVSFARIFFRNSINIGLPLLESPDVFLKTDAQDELSVDLQKGIVRNITKGLIFDIMPYPSFMSDIINAGGLIEYTARKLREEWALSGI